MIKMKRLRHRFDSRVASDSVWKRSSAFLFVLFLLVFFAQERSIVCPLSTPLKTPRRGSSLPNGPSTHGRGGSLSWKPGRREDAGRGPTQPQTRPHQPTGHSVCVWLSVHWGVCIEVYHPCHCRRPGSELFELHPVICEHFP